MNKTIKTLGIILFYIVDAIIFTAIILIIRDYF